MRDQGGRGWETRKGGVGCQGGRGWGSREGGVGYQGLGCQCGKKVFQNEQIYSDHNFAGLSVFVKFVCVKVCVRVCVCVCGSKVTVRHFR